MPNSALSQPKFAMEESFQYSGPTAVHQASHRHAATASAQRAVAAILAPALPFRLPFVALEGRSRSLCCVVMVAVICLLCMPCMDSMEGSVRSYRAVRALRPAR